MKNLSKRLDALERTTRPPTWPDIIADLLLIYGTPAEQAAGRPKVTRPEICAALDLVYAVDTP
jgi:hypothetical protein